MDTYIIGYDLNRPGQDYEDLFEKIKSIANGWWHHLDSTWIIKHAGPATAIRDALKPLVDSNDELLVVNSGGAGAWVGFNTQGSEWLKENL